MTDNSNDKPIEPVSPSQKPGTPIEKSPNEGPIRPVAPSQTAGTILPMSENAKRKNV